MAGKLIKINLIILFSVSLIFVVPSCDSEDCTFNAITTNELPEATLNEEYFTEIGYDITCSYTDKECEIIEGELPAGITLTRNGKFQGTPTEAGTFPFTLKVTMCFGTGTYAATDCTSKEKELELIVNE